jgi:2-polyprenyl-3-methyl-5-hydroxy-6-metoxy-1,4-benzoquinol methylase
VIVKYAHIKDGAECSLGTMHHTYGGSIITNGFGFGVWFGGKYTTNEIFHKTAEHKPKAQDANFPAVADWNLFNDFAWNAWSRHSPFIGEQIVNRCKMHTPSDMSDEMYDDYIGTGDSVWHSWPRYITGYDRIGVLTRLAPTLKSLKVLDLGCACGNSLLGLGAYGMDVYGVEYHPRMYNDRNALLKDRIVFGDALGCLYQFNKDAFDVVVISMVGNIWWTDVPHFLTDVSRVLRQGGIVLLDVMPHKHTNLKSKLMYKGIMKEAGIPVKLTTDNMLVGVKARQPA